MGRRRDILAGLLAAPLALRGRGALAQPTPSCGDEATPRQTEGPYFLRDSPERRDLSGDRPGAPGFDLGGFVTDRACRPLPGALVELWQADEAGSYDVDGFTLRGHLFTDDAGRWLFATVRPGLYPGRTRHFHLKVQARGGPVLTTQLYFPDEPGNARDRIFDPRLVMAVAEGNGGPFGRYDFVLA